MFIYLQDVHGAYKKAKAKQDELWAQLKDRENDIQELQHRYEEKSREKRLLAGSVGKRPSSGNDLPQHFQAHATPLMPQNIGRIDTRVRSEPGSRMMAQEKLSGQLHRGNEQLQGDLLNRRTSLSRSLDSGLTPPTMSRDPRERAFRPLSPYTRQPGDVLQRPERGAELFSKRRIF